MPRLLGRLGAARWPSAYGRPLFIPSHSLLLHSGRQPKSVFKRFRTASIIGNASSMGLISSSRRRSKRGSAPERSESGRRSASYSSRSPPVRSFTATERTPWIPRSARFNSSAVLGSLSSRERSRTLPGTKLSTQIQKNLLPSMLILLE